MWGCGVVVDSDIKQVCTVHSASVLNHEEHESLVYSTLGLIHTILKHDSE